jgi:hypothetical protein
MGFVGHAQTLTAFGNILASLRHEKSPLSGGFFTFFGTGATAA